MCPAKSAAASAITGETLEVKYKGKSIYDVLNMTVEEALPFFEHVPSIRRKIQTLYDVGLSYIRLGQPPRSFPAARPRESSLPRSCREEAPARRLYPG